MSDIGGIGFNPAIGSLSQSTAVQAQENARNRNQDDEPTAIEEAQAAAQDPATSAINQVQSPDSVQETSRTAANDQANTNAQAGQGRTVEDQVVLSTQAQSIVDQQATNAAADNAQTDAVASNPTAGAASDELTNTSRVDGNQDAQGQANNNRERAQLIDQFA